MPARASLSFDEGIRTVSCMATVPFLMRVSMSATGSVIVIGRSPTRLGDAGNLPGVHHLAEADAAQPEFPVHRPRPPAAATTGVGADPELGLALLLLDECLLGQWLILSSQVSRRNGKPNASSSARPSASVRAV